TLFRCRRREDDRRARGSVRIAARRSRGRAQCAAGFWQYVGGDRSVRVGAHAGAGAQALPPDCARSGLHGRFRHPGAWSAVTAARIIIGLVLLQRLLELLLAQRNARLLLEQGGVEYGAGHYPYFVLLHASWL